MSTPLRPPDAGTRNEWTFVGGKVIAQPGGLPAVLGRPLQPADGVVIVLGDPVGRLTITPHQARALAEVLPAAAEHAALDDERCPACGNPAADGPHGMSEYGGCI